MLSRLVHPALALTLLAPLHASPALAQDRQLRPANAELGVSLERYCAAQMGRSDLSEADLSACRERLQAEVAEFDAIDPGQEPVAGRTEPARDRGDDLGFYDPDDSFQFDDLDGQGAPGRATRAAKKSAGGAPAEDFEAEDEPEDGDEEFGFNFEFEGQQEPEDPVEDFDFDPIDDPDAEPLGDLEDAPRPKAAAAHPAESAPTGTAVPALAAIQLDVLGKTPLGDNYAPQIVAVDRDSVVVELPILLGRSRADFDGIAYCVVAEVLADGRKVAEARQEVTSASLAEFGPSFAFVKLLAPVTAKTGRLEIRVSKASSMTGKGTQIFARSVSYQLP